jgi:hypothetical protein
MTAAFLDRLRATAEACERKEEGFRVESRKQLEALVAVRIAAYRRYHLLKGMAEAAAECNTSEAASAAQLDFALVETGWGEADAAYDEVRERLAEVAAVIAAAPREDVAGSEEADVPILAFTRFEAWYRDRFGSEFLDLLERDRAFLPIVDF